MKLKQKKWSSTLGSLDLWSFQLRLCLPIQISDVLLFVCWLERFFRCSYRRSLPLKNLLDLSAIVLKVNKQTNERQDETLGQEREKLFADKHWNNAKRLGEKKDQEKQKDFPDLEENLRLPSITRLFAYEITEWCCMGTGRKKGRKSLW